VHRHLTQKLQMSERHVTSVATDVGEQLEKREVMLNIPDKIGKKYQEGNDASEPDPWPKGTWSDVG
jgi:hypothetical protein